MISCDYGWHTEGGSRPARSWNRLRQFFFFLSEAWYGRLLLTGGQYAWTLPFLKENTNFCSERISEIPHPIRQYNMPTKNTNFCSNRIFGIPYPAHQIRPSNIDFLSIKGNSYRRRPKLLGRRQALLRWEAINGQTWESSPNPKMSTRINSCAT